MRDLKNSALLTYLTALKAVDVDEIIRSRFNLSKEILHVCDSSYDLNVFSEVVVVGLGKASVPMGRAVEEILGDRFSRGLLVTNARGDFRVRSEVVIGGHPLPDEGSLQAGRRVREVLSGCGPNSLVVFLISGGGSAMVEEPVDPEMTLEMLQQLNEGLTKSGATIREINTVRKSISRMKGGGLREIAAEATSVGLMVSDVNPGDIGSLASNPLIEEEPGDDRVEVIVERCGLPSAIRDLVIRSSKAKTFGRGRRRASGPLQVEVILDNTNVVEAARLSAAQRGFSVAVDEALPEEGCPQLVRRLTDRMVEIARSRRGEPVCVISGGEALCEVRGRGLGGRSQEFVIYSAIRLRQVAADLEFAVLSAGTDGLDGSGDSAGAVAGPDLAEGVAGERAVEFLTRNDSHSFLRSFGGLIMTGPTGNNVRDLRLLLGISR